MTADAVIVGGGIVGAACADALSSDGLRVALIEASDIGAGATAAGMGHLVAMDDSDAQFALTSYSLQLWHELRHQLPASVEFDAAGTLWVAADGEEMEAVHAKRDLYGKRGVKCEILDARQLAEAEPELRRGLAGALRVPSDAVIYAPCAARWLVQRARARGAWIREGVSVMSIGEGALKLSDDSRIDAGRIVVAAGTWTNRLAPELPVRKRKGHLAITDRYPRFVRHQIVELGYLKSAHGHDNESVACNIQPRSTGQVLIGSSRQYGVETGTVERHMLERMLRRALEYVPRLRELQVIRTWTGFRAATPDSLPLIGPSPRDERIVLATGHEGLGITTALGTARLIADRLMGREPAIPEDPYLPSRFSGVAA